MREYRRRDAQKNPERDAKRKRLWKKNNPEKVLAHSRANERRRIRLYAGGMRLGSYKIPKGMSKEDVSATLTAFRARQKEQYRQLQEEVR